MSWPCRNYILAQNPSERQLWLLPRSSLSSLVLSPCAAGEPGEEVECSPEHPPHYPEDHHLQCNSYTAFSSLAMAFDWFSLLVPIILFLYKVRRKSFVTLGHTFSPGIQQIPWKNKQGRWYMKKETAWFPATTPTKCKEKNNGRKRISCCFTTIDQLNSL